MFKSLSVGTVKSPLVVVGVFSDEKSLPAPVRAIDREVGGAIDAARARAGFKGEAGEFACAEENCHILGLGKKNELTTRTLRTAGAKLIRALDRMQPKRVKLVISESIPARQVTPEAAGSAFGEGMGIANWRVDQFDGSATKREPVNSAVKFASDDKAFAAGLKDGLLMAEAVNEARRLGATPPNVCNPTWMAAQARKLARETGLKCTVIDFKKAQQLGMGGIVNVGKASKDKPCLIVLEHKPARIAAKAKGQKVALVGKTITYDTGGYSLKISGGMKGMKYDKCGGTAVFGAMRAFATRKLPVHVIGLLPCAENMVSGEAYRPDDIITMYNKVTVEVTNTDAEGRLVLADALAYADEKLKATAIIDAATLTGGVVVALGKWSAGVWASDDALYKRLQSAADETGEKIWRMPVWTEHKDFMRAKHADLWNSGPARDGHPIQGAAFLSFFVKEDTPWAHVDIAGMSNVDNDTDLYVQGPTGYGVRLLTETVASYTA